MNDTTTPASNLIDGKAFAAKLRSQVAGKVAELKANHGITPGLAVVRVGEDPASEVYVRNKAKQTREVSAHLVKSGQQAVLDLLVADTVSAHRADGRRRDPAS